MTSRHGGKLQIIGEGAVDAFVRESRRLDRVRSIRNDFILAGVLIAGAALVFFLVIDTARASASQPHQPGGGGYVLFYTPLSLAVRHLIRAVRRLRSPT